jgi:hypothetical protein
MAKKSRDADHLQNFVYDQQAGLDAATLTDELEQAGQYIPIPDYAYDCHTPQGGRLYIITEHDRSTTTILLPSEY